jgi:peroxiredoxin
MAALAAGTEAPGFILPQAGGGEASLADALRRGPVVLAFFKVSCPTCQYTFPFLERLYRAYPREKVAVLGVSQDAEEGTLHFLREYGVTFPVLLDDTATYPVSNAYGLAYVPAVFLISPAGKVDLASEGWFRPEFEELNARLASALAVKPAALLAAGEDVLHAKAG